MVRVVFDPHQSPIWFKAICILAARLKALPLPPSADQKTFGTMPIPFVLLQTIWF
jgi:hypothetical protein